jgi:hypothetical protein
MARTLQTQIVSRALELIADDATWTRGAMARTAAGNKCAWSDTAAVRFCAAGALGRAVDEIVGAYSFALVQEVEKYILAANNFACSSLPTINDLRGHAFIVAMFRRALAH